MNRFIWFLLSAVFLLPGIGFAATSGPPSAPLARFTCSGSSCTGVPNDSSNTYFATISSQTAGLALDATIQSVLAALQAPLTFNLPTGASTSALQTTANGYLLTLSTFTTSASTSALQSTGNGFLSTLATASASQATGAKQDTGNTSAATTATNTSTIATAQGAQGTGSTFNPPAGGSGILGYLSGIYKAVTGTLTVGLPSNAAQEGGGNLAAAAGSTATTATNTGNTSTNTGAISTATGAQADAAYSGSGSSSIIAALKGIYAKLAGTLTVSGTVTTTPSGTQTVSGSVTSGGYTLTGSPAPISVTTSSAAATGLTLPGKVRFQASPVTTLGGGTISTVAVQVNYSGGNACTQPDVVLGAGQIDDWISITTATAPTVCAAASTNVLVTQ